MSINLSLRQLEIFAATAKAGNFSAAARTLSLSQPALSIAIAKIEAELKLQLFERSGRGVALTADGRHLAAVAEDLLRDVKLSLQAVAARSSGLHARLTIAVLPSIATSVLPRALSALQKRYPLVDIAICDVMHDRAVRMVADGIADFAVTTRIAESDALSYEEIGADEVHLVCRRDHALGKARTPLPWSALRGHAFVAMAGSTSVRRLADAVLLQADFATQPRYEVEQIASAIALVSAGLGVTALPALTFTMFSNRNLVTRRLKEPYLHRQLGFLTLKGRRLTTVAEEFRGAIRTAMDRELG